MDASIEIDGLRKRFGPVQALDGMTFTVHPGQVTGFVGPNGAGKSTTMRVVVGLDAPDAGTATIGGRPYRTLRNPLRHVGTLLDAGALQPSRSARNHLLWLAHSQGIKAGRVDEVIALAVRVGGRRAGAGLLPAAPERRMSLTARVAPPRYLLGQALHAEWTKFRTVAGPAWLLAGVVTLTVAVAVAAASAARCQSATCGIDPATVSFTGIYPAQAAAAVAGVLAIGNEYSTGMIKLSLTAMPRRLTWFFAKATVLTAPVLTASALAVAGAALAGRLILPGHGFTPAHGYASLTSATDFRAAVGAVLYLTLIALLSLGLAAAVRDSAAAIGLVLGVLYLFPLAADVISNPALTRHLDQIGPLPAGLDAQATTGVKSLPLTPWQGLGVVTLWTAGTLLLGALVLKSRDA